jgi:hypothetical protein
MRRHRNPQPRLSKLPSTDNPNPGITPARRLTKGAFREVEESLDELRQLIARTAASVYATEDLFEKFIWDDRSDERDEDRRIEHLSHLMSATRASVMEAVERGEEISAELIRRRVVATRGARS